MFGRLETFFGGQGSFFVNECVHRLGCFVVSLAVFQQHVVEQLFRNRLFCFGLAVTQLSFLQIKVADPRIAADLVERGRDTFLGGEFGFEFFLQALDVGVKLDPFADSFHELRFGLDGWGGGGR